jgi:hypothetical protein
MLRKVLAGLAPEGRSEAIRNSRRSESPKWSLMTTEVPISHRLDLYRYWDARRNGHLMPARRDIDPADIPALLRHVSLIHKLDGQFRFRLVGSAAGEHFGRDLTGDVVGSHGGNALETVADVQAVCERVFATRRPVFTPGHYETGRGIIHHASALYLPLSDDGTHVNMILFMRILFLDFHASLDRLKGARLKIVEVFDVGDAADLERQIGNLAAADCTANRVSSLSELSRGQHDAEKVHRHRARTAGDAVVRPHSTARAARDGCKGGLSFADASRLGAFAHLCMRLMRGAG